MKNLFLILFIVMTSICVMLSIKVNNQHKKIKAIEVLVEKQNATMEESSNKLAEIMTLTKGNIVLPIDDVFVIWKNGYLLGQVRVFQYIRGIDYSAKSDSIDAMVKLSEFPTL